MLTLLAIVHVLIGIGLVIFVLLQDPKGGGAGGMFGGGGGSNTVFGSTGAGNFLTASTKWFAIFFAVSCLTLTCVSSRKERSVLDTGTTEAPATAPVLPTETVPPGATPDGAPPTEPTAPAPTDTGK